MTTEPTASTPVRRRYRRAKTWDEKARRLRIGLVFAGLVVIPVTVVMFGISVLLTGSTDAAAIPAAVFVLVGSFVAEWYFGSEPPPPAP